MDKILIKSYNKYFIFNRTTPHHTTCLPGHGTTDRGLTLTGGVVVLHQSLPGSSAPRACPPTGTNGI
jgi:hypothetical protein